jgi:hypothetical protein
MVLSSDFRLSTETGAAAILNQSQQNKIKIKKKKKTHNGIIPPKNSLLHLLYTESILGCSPPISNPPLHQDVIQVWRIITSLTHYSP